jgi:hypothetical protein
MSSMFLTVLKTIGSLGKQPTAKKANKNDKKNLFIRFTGNKNKALFQLIEK